MENTTMKKKRMANMELLRILSMMMVVMLHYLDKGGVLPELTGMLSVNGYAAWILETLSIAAVNVYMLISGFFLVESSFKCGRLLQILVQVLFYSLLLPILLLWFGILDFGDITLFRILHYVLPTQMKHYWFVTAYVTMYLFSPILNIAVRNMSKIQLKITLVLLLCFFSVSKSILPVRLEMDAKGYDGLWFICVYLTAAYIRLYGIPFFKNSRKALTCYLGSCAGILGMTLVLRLIYLKTGRLGTVLTLPMEYNHILNLLAAISIFYVFYYYKVKSELSAALIGRIGPYTFGVYLLHEQIEIRNLWPRWLGASAEGNVMVFLLRCLLSVLLVFGVGILADMLRGFLFGLAGRLPVIKKISLWLKKIDDKLAGKRPREKIAE